MADSMGPVSTAPATETEFAGLVERYRRELQVHCYRMTGSLDESEDLVQETFLRAWRSRSTYQGRSTFRAWLYKIATNACLDSLAGRARRVMPQEVGPAVDPNTMKPPRTDIPWLQPYPDRLLEPAAPRADEPDELVVEKETIELMFLAAIQHLSPRQRAALILRDVLDWSAKDTAELLESSVAAANSALQRARATLKEQLPARRADWTPTRSPSEADRTALRRYMEAVETGDPELLASLLRKDARATMPPWDFWFDGRDTVVEAFRMGLDTTYGCGGEYRIVPVGANRQPGVAVYRRETPDKNFTAMAINLLHIEDGEIVEITSFVDPKLFAAFGQPLELADDR